MKRPIDSKSSGTDRGIDLRQHAEEVLSKRKAGKAKPSSSDALRLIHELEVHQIELELQNEELVQARAGMEEALIQYTNLYDFAPVGYVTLTREGRIHEANLAAAQLLGVERALLLNNRIGVFVAQESLPALNQFLEELDRTKGERSCELILQNSQGSRWAHLEGTCFEGGELSRTTLTDIDQRKRAEQALQRHVLELELLYDSGLALNHLLNPQAIGEKVAGLLEQKMDWHHIVIRVYDPAKSEFRILVARHFVETREDSSPDPLENLNAHAFKPGDSLGGLALETTRVIRSGDLAREPEYKATFPGMRSGLYVPIRSGSNAIGVISIESRRPDAFTAGDERLVTTLASQAAIALENASLFQSANKELVAREKAEMLLADERNQLAHRVEARTADLNRSNADLARALRAKDEFLASMSHELRTPLAGILGLAESLQQNIYGDLQEKQIKVVELIQESGRHLLELINDILDLSKLNSGMLEVSLEDCSLEAICRSSLHLTNGMSQKRNQRVAFSFPNETILVHADARRLKQVLVNLLSNAIKFTAPGGKLGLDVELDERAPWVKVTVWDKGIGIKPEDMHKLFVPFSQIDARLSREYAGTGLGLSMVKEIVDLMKGSIQVESVFGEGSRFMISLPVAAAETVSL